MGRILALDVGEKRIGLAISDDSQTIANPFTYTVSPSEIIAEIKKYGSEELEKIIIGLPLNLEGKENQQTRYVKKLGEKIKQECQIDIEYLDERFSTKAASHFYDSKNTVPLDCIVAQLLLDQHLKN